MINTSIYTKGGRGCANDCGVRALATAACISYDEAFEYCKAAGRPDNDGMYLSQMHAAIKCALGSTDVTGTRFGFSQPTLKQWLDTKKPGHWVLLVTGHFVAVVDGEVHDWARRTSGMRRRVRAAIRLV